MLTDDKIDEQKFMRFGAWVISTWGFVYLVVDNNLSEWYFVGYIGVWVSNAIFDKFVSNKHRQEPQDKNNSNTPIHRKNNRSDATDSRNDRYPEDH